MYCWETPVNPMLQDWDFFFFPQKIPENKDMYLPPLSNLNYKLSLSCTLKHPNTVDSKALILVPVEAVGLLAKALNNIKIQDFD